MRWSALSVEITKIGIKEGNSVPESGEENIENIENTEEGRELTEVRKYLPEGKQFPVEGRKVFKAFSKPCSCILAPYRSTPIWGVASGSI